MKSDRIILLLSCAILLAVSCKPKKNEAVSERRAAFDHTAYRGSVKMVNDLVHTKLELKPDFENKELIGTATIMLKPHFYPVDSLILNAKYMRIVSVEIQGESKDMGGLKSGFSKALPYAYDSLYLRIKLDRTYTSKENYTVRIEYVAQPEKVHFNGSEAITDSKGIYFIGPTKKDPKKPVQVWTQGETDDASSWFPTIDAPNQKSSQELSVTIPKKFKSISNGKYSGSLEFVEKGDTLRTDYWIQDKPHAPYLFALAIGDFAEVKDNFMDIPVNYYVEPEYEQYARLIFGNTPEMIEFFSTILKTPYPWDKYHQVVVRDFVSGAMENTGCVIHFDKLQHNARQHLDNSYEEVISHELFHHWFGDLVTCESWSNLPLNESFATYGEYLWDEHKYGRDEADVELQSFRDAYFDESSYKMEEMVRYDYEHQEDMFDAHSYQKGGLILHMLRKHLGDEAFFASLTLYLNRYKFRTAEMSDLRTCFEEVSGEDLNWFFNQWFFGKGHPVLEVTQKRIGDKVEVKVVQKGDYFRLPLDIDVVSGKDRKRNRMMLEKDSQVFVFDGVDKDAFVQFDAENQLLADVNEVKSIDEWKKQFELSTLAFHRNRAFGKLMEMETDASEKMKYCRNMINQPFHTCRELAYQYFTKTIFTEAQLNVLADEIREKVLKDPSAAVRKESVALFNNIKDEKSLAFLCEDSSYAVAKRAIVSLGIVNKQAAYKFANERRFESEPLMQEIILIAIGKNSSENEQDFFLNLIRTGERKTVLNASKGLSNFLVLNKPSQLEPVLDSLTRMAESKSDEKVRNNALISLKVLRDFYLYEKFYIRFYMNTASKDKKKQYQERLAEAERLYDRLSLKVKELEKSDK